MKMMAGAAALLLGLLAAACNGEVVGGGQRPARVEVVSGDMQSDTVGKEVAQPLVVRVVDDRDRPVKNQLVNFVVITGGGSVFAGAAITNAQGEARERWTLGTVAGDTQRVEARAVDAATGEAIVFDTFRAIGVPDVPASMSAAWVGEGEAAPETNVAPAPAVRVTDQYGNRVPGVSVTWAVTSGGGTVSAAGTHTNADGVATVNWVLGPGTAVQTLAATAPGLGPVQFAAKLLLPVSVAKATAPSSVAANSSTEYSFLVLDAKGRPLPNTPVQWTLSSPGGATLTPTAPRTGGDGIARATLTVTSLQADHLIGIRAGNATSGAAVSVAGPVTVTDVSGRGARGHYAGYAQARVSSTAGAILRVRASIAGREGELSYDNSTGLWRGEIDLASVAGGAYTGTIIATDAAGNSRAATFEAPHSPNPVVVIVEPSTDPATARGSIRIRATCSWQTHNVDDDCADLYSWVYMGSTLVLPALTGRSGIDITVPLPGEAATVVFTVQWADKSAVYYLGTDTVTVTVTP
ncbi:MAG TPA: Ig-like domain-containing protein [Longimicrobium sp.]|jgi:hypothetical protein|uniref:Ig-like domain-containing protein n=1 Tax=Longimicrobium sp. TaxID=2029185 RepID=UPI002EDA3ACC